MNPSVLVLGSRGNVGRPLVDLLSQSGHRVLAAQRQAAGSALPAGVTAVHFDLSDPSTFDGALDGADRVFVLSPPGLLAADQLLAPFLNRAFEQPRKFVLMTASGVEYNEEAPLRKVERLVEASGHPYVFLRPNWFMDNFHTFWLPMIQHGGTITLPAGDSRSAFISARDIAASAFAALTSNQWDREAITLTGPTASTYEEAAAALSQHTGKTIAYRNISGDEFVGLMKSVGLPVDYAQYLAFLFSFVRQGASAAISDGVQRLTGRAPESLADYIQRNLASWR